MTSTSIYEEKGDFPSTATPKRHPPGPVCIDILFDMERYDKNKFTKYALLYRDMILFSLSSEISKLELNRDEGKKRFKTTHIKNWVLSHNQDYIDRYQKSQISKSNQMAGIDSIVKDYLRNLEQWDIITYLRKIESEKNREPTVLYEYTEIGMIVAWVLEYDLKPEKREIARLKIFSLIQKMYEIPYSYDDDFKLKLYGKLMRNNERYALFDGIIHSLIILLKMHDFEYLDTNAYLRHALNMVRYKPATSKKFAHLYLETLKELPENARKIMMLHTKSDVENRLRAGGHKDWEEKWLKNIDNHDTLVLMASCRNGKCDVRLAAVEVSYRNYIEGRSSLNGKSLSNNYLSRTKCPSCKTRDTLYVYDDLNDIPGWSDPEKKLFRPYGRNVAYDGSIKISDVPKASFHNFKQVQNVSGPSD